MTQKDFLNLSQNELLHGFNLSFANSMKLFEAAEELSSKGFISPAISLMVLSAEEACKSIILLFKFENPDLELDIDIYQLFTSHDYKLSLLKDIYESFVESNLCFLKFVINDIRSSFDEFGEFDKYDKFFVKRIKDLEKINLNKITSWLEMANMLKIKGLYLDYKKGAWISPEILSREKYLECFDVVGVILTFLTMSDLKLNIKNNKI